MWTFFVPTNIFCFHENFLNLILRQEEEQKQQQSFFKDFFSFARGQWGHFEIFPLFNNFYD